ncbi:hypothetical protein IAT38_003518 [Cryptococcus sp. DSM 104549]
MILDNLTIKQSHVLLLVSHATFHGERFRLYYSAVRIVIAYHNTPVSRLPSLFKKFPNALRIRYGEYTLDRTIASSGEPSYTFEQTVNDYVGVGSEDGPVPAPLVGVPSSWHRTPLLAITCLTSTRMIYPPPPPQGLGEELEQRWAEGIVGRVNRMKGELRKLRILFRPKSSTVKRVLEQLVAAGRIDHPFQLEIAGSDNKVCEVLDVVAPWLAKFIVSDISPESPLRIEEVVRQVPWERLVHLTHFEIQCHRPDTLDTSPFSFAALPPRPADSPPIARLRFTLHYPADMAFALDQSQLDCNAAPKLLKAFYPMMRGMRPPIVVPCYQDEDGSTNQWMVTWGKTWMLAYQRLWGSQNGRGLWG